MAFAARHQRGAGGRVLRCPPSAFSGWACPALSAFSLQRVGVACAVPPPLGLEQVAVAFAGPIA